MSLEKFICPYYHHIAPIMKFSRKIKPSLEIHMKIWPASKIAIWKSLQKDRSFNYVTWKIELSLLSVTMLQFSKADLDLPY